MLDIYLLCLEAILICVHSLASITNHCEKGSTVCVDYNYYFCGKSGKLEFVVMLSNCPQHESITNLVMVVEA